ncbi:MAG TPA: hypothetical protein VH916_11995 [Dehalococcoidia bacterium]|jgi:hypothetical protein
MTSGKARYILPLLSLALAVALSLGATRAAHADQEVATGTWNLVSHTQTLIGTAGGNQFFQVVESPAYVGGLTGTAVDTYILIVHSDGSLNGHGVETCDGCTIGGRTGDYTATFSFSAAGSQQHSRLTFQGGTGGLTGLHGGGSFVVTHTTPTTGGTYSYAYHFAP